jgi:hypothetical protein
MRSCSADHGPATADLPSIQFNRQSRNAEPQDEHFGFDPHVPVLFEHLNRTKINLMIGVPGKVNRLTDPLANGGGFDDDASLPVTMLFAGQRGFTVRMSPVNTNSTFRRKFAPSAMIPRK